MLSGCLLLASSSTCKNDIHCNVQTRPRSPITGHHHHAVYMKSTDAASGYVHMRQGSTTLSVRMRACHERMSLAHELPLSGVGTSVKHYVASSRSTGLDKVPLHFPKHQRTHSSDHQAVCIISVGHTFAVVFMEDSSLQWDILPLICHGSSVKVDKSLTCIAVLDVDHNVHHRCMRPIGPKSKRQAQRLAYGTSSQRGINESRPRDVTIGQLNELVGTLLCSGDKGHQKSAEVRQQAVERCGELLKVKIEGRDTRRQLKYDPRFVLTLHTGHNVDHSLTPPS